MKIIEYSSNNSGGDWWLKDEDWINLEKAGWVVKWRDRWLGAIATEATRTGLSLAEAIDEWERITGQWEGDLGCPCCGRPHYFYESSDSQELEVVAALPESVKQISE